MSKPYLTSRNHARIKTLVYLGSWKTVNCLIDTGFSGGISLPEELLHKSKIEPLGYQEYELADGSRVVFGLYEAKVRLGKITKPISLIFTKSEDALVGIEFLTGFKFVLNLKDFTTSLQ